MENLANKQMDIDNELINRVAAQEKDALAELYDRHAPQMLAVALRILKTRNDAEDLIHDVFLEIWRKAGDFDRARGTVLNWILIRVRSRAIDRLRALSSSRKFFSTDEYHETEYEQTSPAPDQLAEWNDARRAIDSLSEPQYNVIVLSYFEGLTYAEIAQRYQIPVGTVKSRLSTAIKHLRNTLKPFSETENV